MATPWRWARCSGIYPGSDGERHDLLLVRIEEAIRDARLHPAYRSTPQDALPSTTD